VDSFDPKPELARHAGKTLAAGLRAPAGASPARGDAPAPTLLPSPWAARRFGRSELEVTELFPRLGALLDRFWVLRGMTSNEHLHAPALRLLLTGHADRHHPAIGAWLAHTFGPIEGADLPAFVALGAGRFAEGDELWGAACLPETCAGAYLDLATPGAWRAQDVGAEVQAARTRLLAGLDRRFAEATGVAGLTAPGERRARERRLREVASGLVEGRRRQVVGAGGRVPAAPLDYGEGAGTGSWMRTFARGCRLTCDLLEAGVRTVQLFSGAGPDGRSPFDVHAGLGGMERAARAADQALAALVLDLDRRGLLDETLLVIATEFGRSPLAEGRTGRDHGPGGFSALIGGSGLSGGKTWGTTDELGLQAVENALAPPDLLANVLARFGLRPDGVTFRRGGRVFSPVDAGSQVLKEIRRA
jgi:hypothetical protein